MPIVVDGHVWGVLEFMARESREPDAPLRILSIIGGQIGMFIRRLETEQQLRETNALQRAILASAHYAIIATTTDGIIRTFTVAPNRCWGMRPRNWWGRTTRPFPRCGRNPGPLQGAVRRRWPRYPGLRGVRPRRQQPVTRSTNGPTSAKDGSRFPVILSVTGIFDSSGSSDRISPNRGRHDGAQAGDRGAPTRQGSRGKRQPRQDGIPHDHQPRDSHPHEWRAGHDRSPASDKAQFPRQRELAEAVSYSGDALLDVINDVLDFSKIEAGKLTLNEEEFALRPLVDGVLEVASHRDPDKCLSLSATVDRRLAGMGGR
jgi:hypothetical protein